MTEGKSAINGKSAKKRGRVRVTGGPGAGWRATVVLAGMLAWAVKRGWRADNPAAGVELNKLQKRERFLSAAELAQLGEALAKAERQGVNLTALAMIRALLLTGARRTEIASLKWPMSISSVAPRLPIQDGRKGCPRRTGMAVLSSPSKEGDRLGIPQPGPRRQLLV